MPNQFPAVYTVTHGPLGAPLRVIHPPRLFPTRGALVRAVNSALDGHGYSRRARRQVDMALLWRAIQAARGSRPMHSFTIENTGPGTADCIRFQALDVSQMETDCLHVLA